MCLVCCAVLPTLRRTVRALCRRFPACGDGTLAKVVQSLYQRMHLKTVGIFGAVQAFSL